MTQDNFSPEEKIEAALEAWRLTANEATILDVANQEDGTHGYEIHQKLWEISGNLDGINDQGAKEIVKLDGSVYRIMKRFVRDEKLTPHTPRMNKKSGGPKRKHFKTTEWGQLILKYHNEISENRSEQTD